MSLKRLDVFIALVYSRSMTDEKRKKTVYLKLTNIKRIEHEAIDLDRSESDTLDLIVERYFEKRG